MGREQLEEDRKKAAEVVTAYVKLNGEVEMSNMEIMKLLEENNALPKDVMYQNSDICYDRTNKANLDSFEQDIHIYSYLGRNRYLLLGLDYPFTGNVYRVPTGQDKAFDKGFISFDNDGKILISDKLNVNDRIFLNINESMQIDISNENTKYLDYHRNVCFKR